LSLSRHARACSRCPAASPSSSIIFTARCNSFVFNENFKFALAYGGHRPNLAAIHNTRASAARPRPARFKGAGMNFGWMDFIEGFDMDPSVMDLVISYPHMSSQQLLMWVASLIAWRLVFSRLEDVVAFHMRRAMAWGLFRLAVAVKP
jgi:hypothetical protein